MSDTPPLLLHIAREDWHAAVSDGAYVPDAFADDGFIHCSTASQLIEVASRHFAGESALQLLCIDATNLKAPVRWENLDGGQSLYPHIYGALNLNAITEVLTLKPGADGRFVLPPPLWRQLALLRFDTTLPVPRSITLRGVHFDGANHWFHPTTLFEADADHLVLSTPLAQKVDTDRGEWTSPYKTTSYYWPDRYFNIVRLEGPDGAHEGWYCNVASPVIFDGEHLTYIDLEFDVRVTIGHDGGLHCEVWDRDEFEAARVKYGYDNALVSRCNEAVQQLIDLAATRAYPFDR